ncbi:MAG: hypothetical protein JWO57_2350 [Pseudonocardiales bacterium]|nr:hypothetical protein [Pseudonocardiales bacterium]
MKAGHARRVLLAAAGLAILFGSAGAVYAASQKADFSLAVNPSSASVSTGSAATYSVTVSGSNGFKSPVTLSASGLPAGATVAFSPNPNTTTTSTLTVQTSSSTAPGTYTLTIAGVGGSLSHSITAGLTVAPPPSKFSLTVSPSTINAPAGTVATYTVTVERTNFIGSIAFSVTGTPSNSGASFTPSSTTGNTTSLQVSTSASTTLGSYSLTVRGSSGTTTATAVAQMTVSGSQGGTPFAIAGTLDRALAPGVTGSLNLSLTNPNNQQLSITNLSVAITSTSKPGCTKENNFSAVQFSGTYPVIVPANSTKTLSQLGVSQAAWPKITMIDLPSNQDICKSTGLSLSYSGTGQGS